MKVTGAAKNCVTLSCILGLGFLVSFFELFFLLIPPQVGFIPCSVSNFIEPYTFTIVNGLAGHLAPGRADYEQAFKGVNLSTEKISGSLFEISGTLAKTLATLKVSGTLFEAS